MISENNSRTWTKFERLLPDNGRATAFLLEHFSGMLISVYEYRGKPYGIKEMFSKDGRKIWVFEEE